jgi:hypothetical protein
MKILIPLLLMFSVGCGVLPGTREQFDRTPAGWHVHWLDQGSIASGKYDKDVLLSLFDKAMERSFPECSAKVGLPEAYVRNSIKERDALYTLHDDSIFKVAPGSADAPLAVWASGVTDGRTHVQVAFYLWVTTPNGTVPADAPAWTIHPNPNRPTETIYGTLPAGREYPALGYELHWQFTEVP